jgi:hypothetical protein
MRLVISSRLGMKQPNYSKPVATPTSQSVAYITVSGIESETSYLQRQWQLFVVNEVSDNPYDWLKQAIKADKYD